MSWVQKKTYYNDRDYRKNAFLKNKNVKIKRLLTFSWHGRHLGLPWLNAGSCPRPPQTNLGNFCLACLALSRCFTGFILSYAQEQRVKTPRRYSFTARTTAQHPKGFIAPKLLTRGRYSTNVYTGRLRPEVQPLVPFYIPFFTKKLPLLYTFYWQMVPLSHEYTLLRTLHSF